MGGIIAFAEYRIMTWETAQGIADLIHVCSCIETKILQYMGQMVGIFWSESIIENMPTTLFEDLVKFDFP